MSVVLVVHNNAALSAITWAAPIAARLGTGFRILVLSRHGEGSLQPVRAVDENLPDLVKAAFDLSAKAGLEDCEVYDCRGYRLRRAALNACDELDAELVVLHDALDGSRLRERGLITALARAVPADVLVLDVGGLPEPSGRVLFAQTGGSGAHGIQFALSVLCSRERPLRVIPDSEARARSARTLKRALDRAGAERANFLEEVDVTDSMDKVIAAEVGAGDLVLVEADESARVSRRLAYLNKLRSERTAKSFAIGVTRSDRLAAPGMLERQLERLHGHLPKLDRDARRAVAGVLERGGSLSADFVVMLTLSAMIAALGLVQNSTAVVIGGMLVAPLMTPLLATALSLIQGNSQQFKASVKATAVGVCGAVAAAMLVGVFSPWSDLSSEIVARGVPNLFDLAIAFFSGVAAAYALSRPGLAGTLVGVAVAVALVPPLAAAAIALVKLKFVVSLGAFVLFSTNLIAIILGATLVFRMFGLDISLGGNRAPRWVRLSMVGLAIALLPISAVLSSNLGGQVNEGVQRAYARPLPANLRDAIRARVALEPGVKILSMQQAGIEHEGFDIMLALTMPGAPGRTLERDLRDIVHALIGSRHPVDVLFLRDASRGGPANEASSSSQ